MCDSHDTDADARQVFDIFQFSTTSPEDNLDLSLSIAEGTVSLVSRLGETGEEEYLYPGEIAETLRGAVFHIKAAKHFAEVISEDGHRLQRELQDRAKVIETLQAQLANNGATEEVARRGRT